VRLVRLHVQHHGAGACGRAGKRRGG
jgi:hypothetical protein